MVNTGVWYPKMDSQDLSEDLEYHITFPSPLSQSVEDEDGDSEAAEDKSREPVVILLGWGGCQDKHLSKYTCIYDKRCITIRYTAPTQDIFYRSKNLKTIASKLLDLLEELNLEENPIFVHLFSNGGGMVYRHMSELIHNDPRYKMISFQGVILDSCPSQPRIAVAAKALMASLRWNTLLCYIFAMFFAVYLFLKKVFITVMSLVGFRDKSADYFSAIMNDPSRCPQLYLYSKADELVSSNDVDFYIGHRKKLGVHVEHICWEDSPHVQHFRRHKEAYITACQIFLNDCLAKKE